MTQNEELREARGEIKQLASRITMRYEEPPEEDEFRKVEVDIDSHKWIDIAPNVQSVRCSLSNENCTVLNVRFLKGGKIERHRHPKRREEIYVIEGVVYDDENGVTVSEGQRYVIPANVPHQIRSDHALITVVFRPPYPEVVQGVTNGDGAPVI